MLYLIHTGTVVSAAAEIEPTSIERWRRGQIVFFSIDAEALAEDVEEAALVSDSGEVWHIEILAATPSRNRSSPTRSELVVRVLRKLNADSTLLALLPRPPRIPRFSGAPGPAALELGAA